MEIYENEVKSEERTSFLHPSKPKDNIPSLPEKHKGDFEESHYEFTCYNLYENTSDTSKSTPDGQLAERYISMNGRTSSKFPAEPPACGLQEATSATFKEEKYDYVVDQSNEPHPIDCAPQLEYEIPRQKVETTINTPRDGTLRPHLGSSPFEHMEPKRQSSYTPDSHTKDQIKSMPEIYLLPKRVTHESTEKRTTNRALVILAVVNVLLVIVACAALVVVLVLHSHRNSGNAAVKEINTHVLSMKHLVEGLCLKVGCSTGVPVYVDGNVTSVNETLEVIDASGT